jgi:hypothetical protein
MGALDALIYGVRDVFADLVQLPRRAKISFGAGFDVTDDDTNEWSRVELAAVAPGGRVDKVTVVAINYTATTSDHVVVAAVNSLTIKLPASPEQGRTFEIKSATGVSGTVIDGNGKNIAGSATYEQSEAENTILRYAGTQWETF